MGNACCKGKINDDDDDSDRARIISNHNNNNYDNGPGESEENFEYYINLNGASQTGDEIAYGSFSCGNKTQEQAALDRIYHRLAMNVIDVAPGEAMIIQPAEVCERQKAYQSRLNQLEGLQLSLSLLTKTGGVRSQGQNLPHLHHSHQHHHQHQHHVFNKTHKLVSRLSKIAPVNEQQQQPMQQQLIGVVDNSIYSNSSSSSGNNNYTNNIDRQKLYQIPDRRRVEYDAIAQDEEELIKEYSQRSMRAVKSLAPTINEPVITQFNI